MKKFTFFKVAKWTAILFIMSLLWTTNLASAGIISPYFRDVSSTTSYQTAIEWAKNRGIVQGYPDGNFRPNGCVNRAELLKMIYEYLGTTSASNVVPNRYFYDVKPADWFYNYVHQASNNFVVDGYSDGSFKPNNCANRVEALKMATNALFNHPDLSSFHGSVYYDDKLVVDIENSSWGSPYANFLFQKKLVGIDHTSAPFTSAESLYSIKFYPADNMLRNEVAQMIYLFDQYRLTAPPNPSNLVPPVLMPPVSNPVKNQSCSDENCLNGKTDYLIVTRPLFDDSAALQEFIAWKKDSGFQVGLVTVEWINEKYRGANLAEKIKTAIYDPILTGNVQYVLLVGDTQVNVDFSAVGWYEPTEMYDLSKKWNVPTGVFRSEWPHFADLYYAHKGWLPLDEMGHPYLESPHYYFAYDKIIGRFPVRKPEEIYNITEKSKAVKPAEGVLSVMNKSFQLNEDPCKSWPPILTGDDALDLPTSDCFTSMPFSIERILNEKQIPFRNYSLDFSNQNERDQARELIFNSTDVVDGVIHGYHTGNEVINVDDVNNFKNIFPLYTVGSCQSNTFYMGEDDSLAEKMLKAEKGPAVVMGGFNKYYLYKFLAEGKTVGEAQFSHLRLYRGGLILQDLMGDPSLKVF